jgi:hypothetical protein
MTPWESTQKLKAANDAAQHQHSPVLVSATRRIVWCAVCGGIKIADQRWELPSEGKT